MRKNLRVTLAFGCLAIAACGNNSNDSSSDTATAGGSKNAGISTPSKMAQQSQASNEYESDTSETAATGSSANKSAASKVAGTAGGTVSMGGDGAGTIQFGGGMDYNHAITGDFNTAFSFHGFAGPFSKDNGSVSCDVHYAGANDFNMTLTYDVNQTLSNGNILSIFTDPSINVSRTGSVALGKVMRTIEGTVRRTRGAVDANGKLNASDQNFTFDFTIDHNNTQVVDTYVSSELNMRTHTGTLTITDNVDHATAIVDFNDVVRGKPQECACPSGGSIEVNYTDPNGQMSSHTYQFGSVCGQVTVVTSGSAAVSADANSTSTSASASAGAQVVTTETWPNCTVE